MLLEHQLVHLTLRIFTEGQLPITSLHMRMQLVSFLLDDYLGLKKFGVVVEQCALKSGALDLHGVKLLLSGFASLLLEVVPVAIMTDLVLQLAYVTSTTRQPALLLCKCLPLRLLLYLQLCQFPLLALPDELQLLRQRIHLLTQLFGLIL